MLSRNGTCLLGLLIYLTSPVIAQEDNWFVQWNQPVEPFQIIDHIYYVGTNEIGAYLIVGDEGHILIDGGFEETAPLIRASIAKLGFEITDVKILLNTHAHFDHCAGLAALKQASGAQLLISRQDAGIIERGGKDDYLLGDTGLFPAVKVDRRFEDGEAIVLGDINLKANVTAGHTKGCTTWTLEANHLGESLDVAIVCSVTILPDARLVNDPSYPGIADDYAKTFEVLEALPVDIFLAPHGQFFDLLGKIEKLNAGATQNPFIDPERYTRYVQRGKERFLARLKKERAESQN